MYGVVIRLLLSLSIDHNSSGNPLNLPICVLAAQKKMIDLPVIE